MHHARRVAERMEQATQDFGKLVADSSTLAALAAGVRESLALLGPRQEAIDSGVAQQAQSLQAMADAITDLRAGFDVATEQLLTQSRRAFDSMGQRAAQSNSALNKELNEALAKAMSGMSKQLNTMSSRLTTDMAPMAQQLKRVTEQARIAR
jgi:gas vesicle protein